MQNHSDSNPSLHPVGTSGANLSTLDFEDLIAAAHEDEPSYEVESVKTTNIGNGLQMESTSLIPPNSLSVTKIKVWLAANGFNTDEIYEAVCDVLRDLGHFVPRPRKLKGNWTMDAVQDFTACHSLDIGAEIQKAVVEEINRDIKAQLRRAAGL